MAPIGPAPSTPPAKSSVPPPFADFNEDGNPDLVTSGSTQLQISFGRPDGTFAAAAPVPGLQLSDLNDTVSEMLVLHGDFNGDGHQDIVFFPSPVAQAVTGSGPVLLLGRGDGTFQTALGLNSVASPPFPQIFVADLNGDHKDDLIVSDSSGNVASYLSLGNGGFLVSPQALTPVDGSSFFQDLVVADVTGDGRPDILYSNAQHLAIMQGRADGTFAPAALLSLPGTANAASLGPGTIAVGDLNADGLADIVVTIPLGTQVLYQGSQVYYFLGEAATSTPSFSGVVTGPLTDRSCISVQLADLTKPGFADLVCIDADFYSRFGSGIAIFPADGHGGLSSSPNLFAGGMGANAVFVADLNHDGHPDLLAVNPGASQGSGNAFTVLLNEPAPTTPLLSGTLTGDPNPVSAAQSFTLTATLKDTAASAALTGTVTFSVDGAVLGSAPLTGYTASIAGPSTLSVGTHQLSATATTISDGANTFSSLTLTATETVLASHLPTTTTVVATPAPAYGNQPVTLTAQIAAVQPSTSI